LRCRHPVTPSEIAAFETGAGVKLPPQFAAFIQCYNGGQPTVMLDAINEIDAGLSEFLPLFEHPNRQDCTLMADSSDAFLNILEPYTR